MCDFLVGGTVHSMKPVMNMFYTKHQRFTVGCLAFSDIAVQHYLSVVESD
jgi:hypothetical protein